MSEVITEAYCWVKAVLKTPPTSEFSHSEQAIDHPLLQALKMQQEGLVAGALSAPPAPPGDLAADAVDASLGFLGGKVDPPPSQDEIPRVPRPQAERQSTTATAQQASGATSPIPGFWQNVSFAPGVEHAEGRPVIILVFQPVPGPRAQAVRWRDANPGWFGDAAAASLLNHSV